MTAYDDLMAFISSLLLPFLEPKIKFLYKEE